MYVWELGQQILREMRARKLRSFLALFGIVWGTISVVVLLALGQGFYQESYNSMVNLTENSLILYPGTTTQAFAGLPIGRKISIKTHDIMPLADILPDIDKITPVLRKIDTKINAYKRFRRQKVVLGVSPDYAPIRMVNIAPGGRFINTMDIKEKRHVIFLGNQFKEHFYGDTDPLGKDIYLNDIRFTVIGIRQAKSQNQNVFDSDERGLFIPYTTFIALWGDKDISLAIVLPKTTTTPKELQTKLAQYLSHRFRYASQDQGAINIIDLAEGFAFFKSFFFSIQLFLGFCGFMTLAVGGIGVANIMFLIVTERTPEIGLRMALGAKPKDILLQILLEAAIIVGLGGFIGLTLSYSLVNALAAMPLPVWLGRPAIIPESVFITLLILTLVALSAGFFPARRAARMQPVQALAF